MADKKYDSTYSILLDILKEVENGGGGGGTSDYNALINKPSINGQELMDNKTLDELGIQAKGNYLTSIPAEYVTDNELENILTQKNYASQSDMTAVQNELAGVVTVADQINGEVI